MDEKNEIMIVDEQSLKDKIYTIRGIQVMIDRDLAEIYGYTTKSFNQQVKNNIEKFPDDFRFQLTREEYDDLRSKNLTSSWGGARYLPYAFSEQGLYMLMSILRGELATKQSITLIRLFKEMKDYIITNQQLMITQKDYMALAARVDENTTDIKEIKENMVTKADLSDFMKLFDAGIDHEEVLILDGQPFKADVAYQKIYRSAKKSIIIVDDYISVKTLQHLVHAKAGVDLTIISDNRNRILKLAEYNDFITEYPKKTVTFLQSQKRAHDRYIVLDNGTTNMKVYHCGASSKDAGKRITTITRLMEIDDYKRTVKELLANPPLTLR
ncbi:MAG: ORF6N domain-containing protein [Firmicutes bacterium]|nr:ORF6N domain-containing protein [Bacillota bacterium]